MADQLGFGANNLGNMIMCLSIGCCLQAEGMEGNMYLSAVFIFPSCVCEAVFFELIC